jgi:hypothetical protein
MKSDTHSVDSVPKDMGLNLKCLLSSTIMKLPDPSTAPHAPRSKQASLCRTFPSPSIREEQEDPFELLGVGMETTPFVFGTSGTLKNCKLKKDGSKMRKDQFLRNSLLCDINSTSHDASMSSFSGSSDGSFDSSVSNLFKSLSSAEESRVSQAQLESIEYTRSFGRRVMTATRRRSAGGAGDNLMTDRHEIHRDLV